MSVIAPPPRPPASVPHDLEALIREARARQRRRRILIAAGCIALAALAVAAFVVVGRGGSSGLAHSKTPSGLADQQNRIRVTLTAQNHHPRVSDTPSVQWWYCVKVRAAAGTSVASTILLQILSARRRLVGVGWVSLKKGYDHWCASVGGEASVLHGLPLGKKLVLQAVVKADGVTVKRNWPIVVR